MSKYGVISGPYFPVFGLNAGIYGPEITPYLELFTQWKLLQASQIKINISNVTTVFYLGFPNTSLNCLSKPLIKLVAQ